VLPPLYDAMLEQKIENISVVFCLIDDKDIFKKYYSKFLAKRLIKGTLPRPQLCTNVFLFTYLLAFTLAQARLRQTTWRYCSSRNCAISAGATSYQNCRRCSRIKC
jgi:hypothetical protein